MIDAARKVNPNLYICAELFTPSEDMDLLFVRKLGINSLIREAIHARNTEDMANMMHRFGPSKPLGGYSTYLLNILKLNYMP